MHTADLIFVSISSSMVDVNDNKLTESIIKTKIILRFVSHITASDRYDFCIFGVKLFTV